MGTEELKHGVVSISVAFLLVFSMILVAPLASSGDWVNRPAPGGTIIEVVAGENFLIRHRLAYDEAGVNGAYTVTMSWANYDNNPDENFTFLMAEAYFTTGPNAGESEQANVTLASSPQGENTIWALSVSRPTDNKTPVNGEFNVDVWLGAWGTGGVPHSPTDNHPIPPPPPADQFAGVIVIESSFFFGDRAPITIRVLEPAPVVRGVDVEVKPGFNEGSPSTWLEYTVTVTNTGNVDDNYDIGVSDNTGWGDNVQLDDVTLAVPASENRKTTLRVHIPDNAIPSTRDNITVTATSTENSHVSAENSCIAHVTVAPLRSVKVFITPENKSGVPKETLTYSVTVKNTGNFDDNYNLAASDNAGWMPWLDNDLLTIPAGENRTTTLTVTIPDVREVYPDEEDKITVTATSTENAEISDSASCIARAVIVRRVKVSISPENKSGVPGENVRFTVTVNNIGNVEDSYNLTASDNAGLGPKVSPTRLGILAGSSDNAIVSVIIPENAASGMKDNITVEATSVTDSKVENYATCIATAATIRGVEVFISPENKIGAPGENVRFTVSVINMGNATDNYALTVIDNENWGPRLSDNLLVNVGMNENMPVTLAVKIPENVSPGKGNKITVIATSMENAKITDNASCIARAAVGGVKVSISPSENRGPPGKNVTFTVTVINTGNATDNYALTVIDNENWAPSIPDNLLENIPPGENKKATLTVKIPENALPGKVDNITVRATSQMYQVVTGSTSCTARVFIVRGVDVSISPPEDNGIPGETLTFTVTVTNTGEAEDNYDLVIIDDASWGATLENSSLSIPFSENRMTTVSVTVPSNAIGNESTEITVTATSVENENASESATCIAIAAAVRRVEVSISPPEDNGIPGETLTFTVTVTNTGNAGDNYSLKTIDNADWPLAVSPTSLKIPPNSQGTATLTVIIPEEAPSGEEDKITVTATSMGDPTVDNNATCIASAVIGRGVEVSIPSPENSGAPGEIVSFTVTIINTGNVDDSYTLGASDNAVPSWEPTVSPTQLGILAGDNGTATVSVIIPEGTAPDTEDEITFTATSTGDPTSSDSVTCIATAVTLRRVEVSISPPENSGAPGEIVSFTVTVTNTGNVSDNYDLTADDNSNWSLTLPNTLTDVIPGGSRTINLGVGIPDDAENSTRDNITVTVTSRADSTVKKSASCTAHAVTAAPPPPPRYDVQVSISPNDQGGSPKETVTFTVTVRNTGEADDSYDLTISDDAGWGATLDQYLLTIPAGESRTTTVSVTVPRDAAKDELTHITVIATSRADPTVRDSAVSRAISTAAPGGPGVELPIPLAISALLIGAAIIVPAYLLRERRKKAGRRTVLRGPSWGLR